MRPNLTSQSPNPNKPENRRGQILFINADAEFHAGRAQNYLRPEHVEKIVSTYDRFEDVPGYARRVPLEEISSPANDWNLNIRRYVDNSPPPELHDVRAHLLGGVPVAEVEAQHVALRGTWTSPMLMPSCQRSLYPLALGNGGEGWGEGELPRLLTLTHRPLRHSPARRERSRRTDTRASSARCARRLVERALAHASPIFPRVAISTRSARSFSTHLSRALSPLSVLDRFKLSGVIATWWTETLPDFKTLLENGFPGVIDGWVDPIADAVDDDEAAGPTFDPFAHKLVRRVMSDYLEQIAAAKTDVARLKSEKEAFEQSNEPDDADEQELKNWNYAKDLERQIRELKAENRDALKELAKTRKGHRKAQSN